MRNGNKMGLFSCIALIIGACIGSAIFSISGVTIYYAGASAILSWIIAACIFGLYGIIVTRLASIFPNSGGIFIFPRLAVRGKKGALLGFFSSWGYIISNIIAIAFSSIYIGIYVKTGFGISGSGTAISIASLLIALIVLLLNFKRSQTIQDILVIVLSAIILVYCGFSFFGGNFNTAAFSNFFNTGSAGSSGFLRSVPLAMVAYGGCVTIAFMAQEVRNPDRNIRKSLFFGLGTVALLYACLIGAIIGTLPHNVLEGNEQLRYIPVFASIEQGGLSAYPWLAKVITVCVVIALLTTIIALLRVNARAIQVVSKEGLLPKSMAKESGHGAAVTALITMVIISILLCFKPEWTEEMIKLGAVLNIVSMAITCLSLMFAEKKPVFIAIIAIVLLTICYIPDIVKGSGKMWLFTAAVYVVGLIIFSICLSHSKRRPIRLTGKVVHGKGHGHLHSIPTANLELKPDSQMPTFGVWATKVFIGDKEFKGLTNVGFRPTDDNSDIPTVETKVLDFNGDLYGQEMTLEFVEYIRGTRKFSSMEELHKQIDEDFSRI